MLSQLRVVELGVWVAGPSAGGILADWGADVIKVESPEGDPMRRMLQVVIGHGAPDSPPFDLDNRGKRSIVLDLTVAEDADRMRRLVETADVFLTNLRPEAVERLGLGPDELTRSNPRLVYAGVTGYGREGPDAGRAGYDVGAFWARSGIASATAPTDTAPPMIRSGLGDHVTGLTTVAGILAALLERETTGRGQVVDTSLLRTGIYCLGWDLGLQMRFGRAAPTNPRDATINPMVNCYRAGDGAWFWLLGVESQRLFVPLCAALGRPDMLEDERYATARNRRHNCVELIAELDALFETRPRHEWTDRFDEHDVWWAPVNTLDDVPLDPQAVASGAFVDIPAGADTDESRSVATPVTFSAFDAGPKGPVPGLGEHTAEVLAELDARRDAPIPP